VLKHGHKMPKVIKFGVMLEIPSLLFDLDALMSRVDFISIGSNDLMQFLFAVDRENKLVANRFDPLHPAMLRALHRIVETANKYNVQVSVCGEMAGRPIEALALMALGFKHLSMSAASIGPVKAMILKLDLGAAQAAIMKALDQNDGVSSLRGVLEQFVHAHKVPV
jgi:phosphotransferase system, enzyme I, PtsP